MNHYFRNDGSVTRLFVDENAPNSGGNGRTGKLYLKGKSLLTTGIRQVKACEAAGLTKVR